MSAMARIADVLSTLKKSPEQLRREKNRRYYESHRERYGALHHAVCKLKRLRDILMGEAR